MTRSIRVDAPAARAWGLVSDLPRMGQLSPENDGGRWLRGARGPVVGARFRGRNARGWRRWSTQVVVTHSEPGRRFAFDVSSIGLPVATWTYDVEPAGQAACAVTETWQDRRGPLIRILGRLVTGVGDRASYTAESIEATLARVAAELAEP